ncbi:ImmA/IrrE family metallo-endopeptidase [uncultured Brachyspira sp.]|uniref:ImmA/IrrE family metallo-endopeptidase n=1 Tax=uncultured Brachyspira sp. TaxID=221953 RepID=UPI0026257578|nr:ImmA/IrrE family metallo-endopeptidase [uncultured Brachyspira sp.]
MSKLGLKKIADICGYTEIAKHHKLLDDLESNVMDNLILKYIEKSLLSHWNSAIENIVLENRQSEFKRFVDYERKFVRNARMLQVARVSLYKIFIKEEDIKICGFLSPDEESYIDIIFINKNMTIPEKRCVVAHELAHIIVERILKEKNVGIDWNTVNEEELMDTIMCYILYDKSNFYKDTIKLEKFIVDGVSEFKKLRESIINKYGN